MQNSIHLQQFSWTPFYNKDNCCFRTKDAHSQSIDQKQCKHLNTNCTTDAAPSANNIIYTRIVIIQQSIKTHTKKNKN